MHPLNPKDVGQYVENHIGTFHQKRIASLDELKLPKVLKRKNPYLFKAKHLLTSEQIVRSLVDAHISSHEETIFGDWLEGLAIFINEKVYNGRKSSTEGIDLEFDKNGIRHIVSIKSDPNWGNHGQIRRMIDNFNAARRTLKTTGSRIHVVAVNGCCYGTLGVNYQYKSKGDYYKYCGQDFWEFISGNSELYKDIIKPLGYKAKEKNQEFVTSYAQRVNQLTMEFSNQYCMESGDIDWALIVQLNSGSKKSRLV